MTATEASPAMSLPNSGLSATAQENPSQCSISGLVWPPAGLVNPTAQALLAEAAATENRALTVPGPGMATWVQALPSQCSASAAPFVAVALTPTAHASVSDVAATELS